MFSLPSKRPYIQYSIVQLEDLFAQAKQDSTVMGRLEHELSFRETKRAAELRNRTRDLLNKGPATMSKTAKPKSTEAKIHPVALKPAPRRATANASETVRSTATASFATADPGEVFIAERTTEPNTPGGILAAWTALEALSPQTYQRPNNLAVGQHGSVAELGKGDLPWERGESSRKNYQLYYQIILGAIPMGPATADLVKAFGADDELRTRTREKAAIAAILVDRNGLLVEDKGIAVSSFAWALPLALKQKLEALGGWPSIEPKVIQALDDILRRTDEAGARLPLDRTTISRAYAHLLKVFDLPNRLAEAPTFAVRVFHYYKSKNPPEASLLNSFYMGDLALAASHCSKQTAPRGLHQYLGVERPERSFDLLNDQVAVEHAVAPARTPAARWPSPGGQP
ncbi:hypothetical protein [Brevundimonas diminuta]|uniref:hypothetical protein n=1 Tax=Brevundimonas diminuta TaxID=293 RepID=UPI00320A386D